MQLLTEELRAQLPALYAQEKNQDPTVYLRFCAPEAGWTWLVTEGSFVGDEFQFFGYVIGQFEEWGFFLLRDLAKSRTPSGARVERDQRFAPAPFSEVIKWERQSAPARPSKGGKRWSA